MATRLQISTHYPERMGVKAGQRNYFPEKIWQSFDNYIVHDRFSEYSTVMENQGYDFSLHAISMAPKTTTIRKNYKFWKSKEGKMIQPFIWAGKPRRSKHVIFCPEVRLKRVRKIEIIPDERAIDLLYEDFLIFYHELDDFTRFEGFDTVEDFFLWFNEDFEGAYLNF